MRNGTCIKCNSKQVYFNESIWSQRGNMNSNTIPITAFSQAILKNYVCVSCGYVESYVQNESKLNKIKEKWTKVDSKQ